MIPAVREAAWALISADTGAGGLLPASNPLLTGGYWDMKASEDVAVAGTSFMVGSVQASDEVDGFTSDGSTGFYAFNIYTPTTSSGNALTVNGLAAPIIARLRTVVHSKSATGTVGSQSYRVFFQASSAIAIDEPDAFYHHVETYRFQCFPL